MTSLEHAGVVLNQLIPWESPNTILTNRLKVRSSGERTSQMTFYIPQGLMKNFSGGFLFSISLLGTNLE